MDCEWIRRRFIGASCVQKLVLSCPLLSLLKPDFMGTQRENMQALSNFCKLSNQVAEWPANRAK